MHTEAELIQRKQESTNVSLTRIREQIEDKRTQLKEALKDQQVQRQKLGQLKSSFYALRKVTLKKCKLTECSGNSF
jgi:hypothetical protein